MVSLFCDDLMWAHYSSMSLTNVRRYMFDAPATVCDKIYTGARFIVVIVVTI